MKNIPNHFLLNTFVRWLLQGNCLTRFLILLDSVIQFLENNDTRLVNLPHYTAVSLRNDYFLIYCPHLENLHDDFLEGFQHILNMDMPDCVLELFSFVNEAGSFLLEE